MKRIDAVFSLIMFFYLQQHVHGMLGILCGFLYFFQQCCILFL